MFNKNEPYILVFGASVVDNFGFSSSKYKPYNSTPGHVKISFGGVCRNIAENLARIGVNAKLISIIGKDEKGKSALAHSRVVGYDMEDSLFLENGGTPTYMAISNEVGEIVSGVVDMNSMAEMTKEFVGSKKVLIENSEYMVLDSDDPEIIEYIVTKYSGKTKFILDPVSAVKAHNIKHLTKYFHTVKPNIYEAEEMSGIKINDINDLKKVADYFIKIGVEKIFISMNKEGAFYGDSDMYVKIKAQNVHVKNVTGAGDSFVSGICYGYLNNLSMVDTVKFAISMSNITIADEEAINKDMSIQKVLEEMQSNDWVEEHF
jgi:sugar/nucleoside kinase (ribokinase family)